MWWNRVYSESPHPCGHFDTKIEVVTMTNISARFFPTLWTRSVIQSTARASYYLLLRKSIDYWPCRLVAILIAEVVWCVETVRSDGCGEILTIVTILIAEFIWCVAIVHSVYLKWRILGFPRVALPWDMAKNGKFSQKLIYRFSFDQNYFKSSV